MIPLPSKIKKMSSLGFKVQEELLDLYSKIKRLKDEGKAKEEKIKDLERENEILRGNLKKAELENQILREGNEHATNIAIGCALRGLGE